MIFELDGCRANYFFSQNIKLKLPIILKLKYFKSKIAKWFLLKTLQTVDIFIVIQRLIITLTVHYYIIYYLYFGKVHNDNNNNKKKKSSTSQYMVYIYIYIDWILLLLYRILYDIILRIVIGRNWVIHYWTICLV